MDSPSIVPVESSTPEPPSEKTAPTSQDIHDAHIGCHCRKTIRLNPNTNIGNNKIIKLPFTGTKKVMGVGQSFFLFLLIYLAMFFTVLIWVISNGAFFPTPTYVIGVTLYLLTAYYMLLCFTTEPGIIPRNHPDYSSKELNSMLNDSDEENKNIKDESKIKPSIFKEKICETCNIIRPPKTSHCRHCDNCVQNLDHHCFFVSNCIGLRNHKFFFLFLFYGVIGAFYIAVINFIHLLYVFFFSEFNIIPLVYKTNKILFFVSLILISISLIYISCGTQDFAIILGPSGVGYGIFIYLFYKAIPEGMTYPGYFNPFSMISFVGSISLGIFVCVHLCIQTRQIMQGYTTKQIASIKNEFFERQKKMEEQIDDEYFREKTGKEKIANLIRFVCQKQAESLIDQNRDL